MTEHKMLSAVDAELLAEAFPGPVRSAATRAAEGILEHLHARQWTGRFVVQVAAESVAIPNRLHFASIPPTTDRSASTHLIEKCLEARSNDGFHRQRAARDLLLDVQPWTAPFIVALIGEYVVEILDDIYSGLTPRAAEALAEFASANPGFWDTIRQRVASYWNVYYRGQFTRRSYIGFRLLDAIEETIRAHAATHRRS